MPRLFFLVIAVIDYLPKITSVCSSLFGIHGCYYHIQLFDHIIQKYFTIHFSNWNVIFFFFQFWCKRKAIINFNYVMTEAIKTKLCFCCTNFLWCSTWKFIANNKTTKSTCLPVIVSRLFVPNIIWYYFSQFAFCFFPWYHFSSLCCLAIEFRFTSCHLFLVFVLYFQFTLHHFLHLPAGSTAYLMVMGNGSISIWLWNVDHVRPDLH